MYACLAAARVCLSGGGTRMLVWRHAYACLAYHDPADDHDPAADSRPLADSFGDDKKLVSCKLVSSVEVKFSIPQLPLPRVTNLEVLVTNF